jgi:hypothetical protein
MAQGAVLIAIEKPPFSSVLEFLSDKNWKLKRFSTIAQVLSFWILLQIRSPTDFKINAPLVPQKVKAVAQTLRKQRNTGWHGSCSWSAEAMLWVCSFQGA